MGIPVATARPIAFQAKIYRGNAIRLLKL